MNGQMINGVFDGRAFRRVRKNSARIKELEGHNEALMHGKEQAAKTAVKDIEDWIRIVQTRTQLKTVMRKVLDGVLGAREEAEMLLEEMNLKD